MSKTAMGSRAALTEAQSLWGKRAAIQRQGGVCRVGVMFLWIFWSRGKGKSWSAAFGDYYDRVGKPEPRIPTKEIEETPKPTEATGKGTGNEALPVPPGEAE